MNIAIKAGYASSKIEVLDIREATLVFVSYASPYLVTKVKYEEHLF